MKNVSSIKGGIGHTVIQGSNNINKEPPTKNKYQIIAICIAVASLAVAIIANWDKIRSIVM